VRFDGVRWIVSAQTRRYVASGLELTIEMLSGLGAALKQDRGPRSEREVTPQTWIERRAKAAGGSAVVQPGAKRRQILQKRGQSALSVIEGLSSDMGTAWCDVDNVLYVGTPWWAFEGGPQLSTWDMPLTTDLVFDFDARGSAVDDANAATANMVVDSAIARKLRQWHRLRVSRAAASDNGLWLVESVNHDLHGPQGTLELSRPRRSTVNKGSSSTADGDGALPTGGDYEGYIGDWVPGADKVWPGTNQTPKQMVATALRMRGQSGPAPTRSGRWAGYCATFTSYLAHKPYNGGPALAKQYWYNMKARAPHTPHGTGRDAPAGSFVVWSGPHSAGHVAISIGNGRMITTTDGPITEMDIGGYIGWGYYLGWMAPASYR
jgi:cell wall-associated NlpC family hydrolase